MPVMLVGSGYYESPIGLIEVVATASAVATLYFVDQHRRDLPATPLVETTLEQLARYFAGSLQSFDLPLTLQGTPFQREVWSVLLQIPFGQVTTYKAIAATVGRPRAMRAVGHAIGRNPLSIIVPCHRVIGLGGGLRGYGGGLWRKAWLLQHEGVTLL